MFRATAMGCFLALLGSSAALSAEVDPLILDLNGDGLDLSGSVQTSLLGGPESTTVNWTKKGTDDGFLVIDATALRTLNQGDLQERGRPINGPVLVRDGLQLVQHGQTIPIDRGWTLLEALDANHDGSLNSQDLGWSALYLFVDANGDGSMDFDEHKLLSGDARSLEIGGAEPKPDGAGNQRSDGTFTLRSGEERVLAEVRLGS